MTATYDDWLTAHAAKPRFGSRDRLGTANYIDELARIRAAESIVSGEPVSLARPMRSSPSPRGDDKPGFSVEVFYTDGPIGMGSDHVELDCHGRANTHLDALNHISIGGHWYAGMGRRRCRRPIRRASRRTRAVYEGCLRRCAQGPGNAVGRCRRARRRGRHRDSVATVGRLVRAGRRPFALHGTRSLRGGGQRVRRLARAGTSCRASVALPPNGSPTITCRCCAGTSSTRTIRRSPSCACTG